MIDLWIGVLVGPTGSFAIELEERVTNKTTIVVELREEDE